MRVRKPLNPRGRWKVVDRCHFETVLRALAEGGVHWAFWPPGTAASKLSETGDGIWVRRDDDDAGVNSSSDGEEEEEMEHDRDSESGEGTSEGEELRDEEGEEEEEEELKEATGIGGRFGALELEEAVTDSAEED